MCPLKQYTGENSSDNPDRFVIRNIRPMSKKRIRKTRQQHKEASLKRIKFFLLMDYELAKEVPNFPKNDEIAEIRMLIKVAADEMEKPPCKLAKEMVKVVGGALASEGGRKLNLDPNDSARFLIFCSACQFWTGSSCEAYNKPIAEILKKRFFCPRFEWDNEMQPPIERTDMDIQVSPFQSCLLMIVGLPTLLIVGLLKILFKKVLFFLFKPLKIVFKALWRGTRWLGRTIATGGKNTWNRIIRGLRTGRQLLNRVSSAAKPRFVRQLEDRADQAEEFEDRAHELEQELETTRGEVKQAIVDAAESKAEAGIHIEKLNALEAQLDATHSKVGDMAKQMQALRRLAKHQKALLDRRHRSARSLAKDRKQLNTLQEALSELLSEDDLITTVEADKLEELLRVAESEVEERDKQLLQTREDLELAMDELELYERLLAEAGKTEDENKKESVHSKDESAGFMPSHFGDLKVFINPRFERELRNLPPHLQRLMPVRLGRLFSNEEMLNIQSTPVGVADSQAYKLRDSLNLRKTRLNRKYRLFLAVEDNKLELHSVAKHA